MPGSSYPAPELLADSALKTLESAYREQCSAEVGSLILKAHELITRLKQQLGAEHTTAEDPYEINENNSAIYCSSE